MAEALGEAQLTLSFPNIPAERSGMLVPSSTNAAVFDYSHNTLAFDILCCPENGEYEHKLYRIWLEGLYTEWSPWFDSGYVKYDDLKEGDYVFHYIAKNDDGAESVPGRFAFIILPPWYRHSFTYAVLAVMLVLGMLVLGFFLGHLTHKLRENRVLKQLNQTKNKMFSIIAHDLRNPMGNLLELLEMCEYSLLEGDKKAAFDDIMLLKQEAKSSYGLLENLLNWSRSQLNTMQVKPVQLSMCELVKDEIEIVYGVCVQKKIQIDLNREVQPVAYADGDMTRLVVRNLLTNAVKFSHAGGVINVYFKLGSTCCWVCIQDHGVGIAPETLKHLFELGATTSAFGTADEAGSGLGLVLCSEFVQLNGGVLKVESRLNEGTLVRFSVPLPLA